MGKRVVFVTEFKAVYIPLPPEMVEIRHAFLLLLLQWIKEDLILNPEDEVNNETVDGNSNGHVGRVWAALFSLAGIAQGKETSAACRIHAWYIGNDGSAYHVVVDPRRRGSD